jgi:ATP:corrinoid adenosyltransferase
VQVGPARRQFRHHLGEVKHHFAAGVKAQEGIEF